MKRRELIDATDDYAHQEIEQVKLQEQHGVIKQRVNVEKPVDDIDQLLKKLQKEHDDKDKEVVDLYDAMRRLSNTR